MVKFTQSYGSYEQYQAIRVILFLYSTSNTAVAVVVGRNGSWCPYDTRGIHVARAWGVRVLEFSSHDDFLRPSARRRMLPFVLRAYAKMDDALRRAFAKTH